MYTCIKLAESTKIWLQLDKTFFSHHLSRLGFFFHNFAKLKTFPVDCPDSSSSCLEIHICWKLERQARMDPPIQTDYFLSGGAMILIFMVDVARLVIFFCLWSAIPGYLVVPPDRTMLAYRSLQMSTSHFMMEL